MLQLTKYDVQYHIFEIGDLIYSVHYANVHERFLILLVLE